MFRARVLFAGVLLALTACAPAVAPRTHSPSPTAARSVSPTPTPTPSAAVAAPPKGSAAPSSDLTSLLGNTRNAIAWAELSNPDRITVEGSVPRSRAWSTSKPLVIAAYLATVVDGDPDRIPGQVRTWIRDALAKSDGPAIAAIKAEIPGSPGAAMTRILRSVGDTTTTAPDSYEGTMHWDVREQVRFMAALGNGEVVSPKASAFLLREMQPIPEQRWGLGTIGARAFKPGWIDAQTETRQMGIVGDYAVAIITTGDGPATLQKDGDYAHEWQMNRLARLLATRLES